MHNYLLLKNHFLCGCFGMKMVYIKPFSFQSNRKENGLLIVISKHFENDGKLNLIFDLNFLLKIYFVLF
jgi:hypothetical protein